MISTPQQPASFVIGDSFSVAASLRKHTAGSFGLCDPASKEMHYYLERLEEQQRLVLELITGKKQALVEQFGTKGSSNRASKQGVSRAD